MYWADELIKKIPNKKTKHRVDDMKTVSGMPHVGSLRAVTTHDIVYKAMKGAGFNVDFTYVFNDMDPMDGLPAYLDPKEYEDHMGKPLYRISSPEKGFVSFGEYYASKYKEAFNKIGCNPQIIWSHEEYASGKMDSTVRVALDNADKIRKIYKKVAGQKKPKNWLPYQVICPQCGKVGSTLVSGWDGKYVTYQCKSDLVDWAIGCGHKGKIEPIGENGKLMWKVDWPAHWKILGVTVEGAGKEHFTEGGSRDIGVHICKEVFNTKPPFGFLHEFFLVGGRKMSSSKGTGIGADEITEVIPPYIVRFLIVRTHLRKAVNFDPAGMTIPDLFDAYDEAALSYWNKKDKKLSRIFELSQVNQDYQKQVFLPRFRDLARIIQDPKFDVEKEFEILNKAKLTDLEEKILRERIKYVKIWLAEYAPQDQVFKVTREIPEEVRKLDKQQKEYLKKASILLRRSWSSPQDLQQELYNLAKRLKIPAQKAFSTIYIALLGKSHGPKAAWLLLENKSQALMRFREVDKVKQKKVVARKIKSTKTKLLSLGKNFSQTYPSASIGFAVIKNIRVKKTNPAFEKKRQQFLKSIAGLTNQEITESKEIQSYHKMYKNMGVDWHSRRPGPEALLRRFSRNNDMPKINTCVDAYNLIVMKNRISVGAFDANQIKFPCQVRIAKGGEKALFIGEREETDMKPGEVCYFDKVSPYNMDYNYRDIIRTAVTEKTKNIWINTEGIYDITPKQVHESLEETIKIIQKICGGKVIEKGLILAK